MRPTSVLAAYRGAGGPQGANPSVLAAYRGGQQRVGTNILTPQLDEDEENLERARQSFDSRVQTGAALGVEPPQRTGFLEGVVGLLDAPGAALRGLGSGLAGVDFDGDETAGRNNLAVAGERFLRGLNPLDRTTADGGTQYGFGRMGGLRWEDDDSFGVKAGKGLAAFAGEVLLDPLTYVSFGGSVVGRRAAGGLLESAADRSLRSVAPDLNEQTLRQIARNTSPEKMRGRLTEATRRAHPSMSDDAVAAEVRRRTSHLDTPVDDLTGGALFERAREALGYEMAEGYVEKTSRGVLQRLEGLLGDEQLARRAFDALPSDLQGGLRFRVPFREQLVDGTVVWRAPFSGGREGTKQTVRLTKGGGRGTPGVLDPLAERMHGTYNAVRASGFGQAITRKFGGGTSEVYADLLHNLYRRSQAATGGGETQDILRMGWSEYSNTVDILRGADRSASELTAQAGAVMSDAHEFLRQADEAVARQARHWMQNRADYRKAVADGTVTDDVQMMVEPVHAYLDSVQQQGARLAEQLGIEWRFREDYFPRLLTKEGRQRLAREMPTEGRAGTGLPGFLKERQGFTTVDVDDAGRAVVRDMSPDEISHLFRDMGEGHVPFVDDPLMALGEYLPAAHRFITEMEVAVRMRQAGLIVDLESGAQATRSLSAASRTLGDMEGMIGAYRSAARQAGGAPDRTGRPALDLRHSDGTAVNPLTRADEQLKDALENAPDAVRRLLDVDTLGETAVERAATYRAVAMRLGEDDIQQVLRSVVSDDQALRQADQALLGLDSSLMARVGMDDLGSRTIDDVPAVIRDTAGLRGVMDKTERFYGAHSAVRDDTIAGFLDKVWAPYVGMFRAWATSGAGPRFHIRNTTSIWNNWLAGVQASDHTAIASIMRAKRQALKEAEKAGGPLQARLDRADRLLREKLAGRTAGGVELADIHDAIVAQRIVGGGQSADAIHMGRMSGETLMDGLPGAQMGVQSDAAISTQLERAGRGKRRGLVYSSSEIEEAGPAAARAMKAANAAIDNRWLHWNLDITEATEMFLRGAAFIQGVRRYGLQDGGQAGRIFSHLTQFDYGSTGMQGLTVFERKWMRQVLPFYCVPEDHEILTRQGWKRHTELTVGEDVLVLDPETHEQRWEPLLDIATFDYNYDLLRYENGNKSFEFTPDHRWPFETATGGERGIKRAWEMRTSDKVPWVGTGITDEDSLLTPRLAAILGWLVTDGYHRWRGNSCEALVYQSPKKHLDEIVELLGTQPRAPHSDTGVVAVPVARDDTNELVEAGFRSKDDLPAIVGRLSRKAAEEMWQAMIDAEASVHPRAGTQFVQRPGPVLEAFQMLCYLTGRGFHIGPERESGVSGGYVRSSGSTRLMSKVTPVPYDGVIWCPKTPTGTWFMRHDGAVIPTGNTWMRHNIPFQFRALWGEPSKFHRLIKGNDLLRDLLEDETAGIAEHEVPQWVRDRMGFVTEVPSWLTPFAYDADTPITFAIETPALDLNKTFSAPTNANPLSAVNWREVGSGINPAMKTPLELVLERNFFTGGQIQDYTPAPAYLKPFAVGEEDGEPMVSGRVDHALRSLVPPLSQVERLAGSVDAAAGTELASQASRERGLTSFQSQMPAGFTTSTLNPRQISGGLMAQSRAMDSDIDRELMRYGLSREELRELLDQGYTPQQIFALLEGQ